MWRIRFSSSFVVVQWFEITLQLDKMKCREATGFFLPVFHGNIANDVEIEKQNQYVPRVISTIASIGFRPCSVTIRQRLERFSAPACRYLYGKNVTVTIHDGRRSGLRSGIIWRRRYGPGSLSSSWVNRTAHSPERILSGTRFDCTIIFLQLWKLFFFSLLKLN